jgi:EAL domain-containing protein (putative c-di-GMP-specific phosphodiesterase class I)
MAMKDAVSTADRACREAKDGQQRRPGGVQARLERLPGARGRAEPGGAPVHPNATEGMFLEMQPIMSLRSPHESLNFEVLLRMREADGRVSPAGPVIAAAERADARA